MNTDYIGGSADPSLILKLQKESTRLETLADESRANRVKADEITAKIKSLRVNKEIGTKCMVKLKKNIARVDGYLTKRKGNGIVNIKTGMLAARAIIPHGQAVKLVYEPGDVYLAGEDGDPVNETDGSGFRSTLALFMRERLLKSTDCIQTMILDEPLTTLDLENSAEISKYIGVMALNSPVILIEQKPEIFVATEHIAYHFEITDGVTHVRKEIAHGNSKG